MIITKVESIMLTGINAFAKEFKVSNEDAQIQVVFEEDAAISYYKAKDFVPQAKVKFTEIMQVKFDILGFQGLVRPFMQQSIIDFSIELGVAPIEVSGFIFLKNQNLYIGIYNGHQFYKHYTLQAHLEKLGLS